MNVTFILNAWKDKSKQNTNCTQVTNQHLLLLTHCTCKEQAHFVPRSRRDVKAEGNLIHLQSQTCSTRGSISTNKCFYSRLTVATTLKFLSLVGCKRLNYVVKKVTVLSAALLFPKGSLHFTPDGLPTATLPFVWAWDWRLVTLACDSLSLGLHLLPVFSQGSFTCKGNMLTSKPWSIFQKTVPSKVFLLIHERASCHHALSDYFC